MVQLEEHLIPKENIGLIEDIKLATLNYDTEEEEYEIKIGMIEDYYESPFPVELENTTNSF
jgi:galactose-1-phosphate uridylyltransferase